MIQLEILQRTKNPKRNQRTTNAKGEGIEIMITDKRETRNKSKKLGHLD